ncbi:hypothetical protein [Pseudonocardia parietis]|uniref:Poly-beta-hydroxybutyrate polymerase N-terminal domain-containing protein n=1 Tax=Pseudonocardia parietis TaxID=570936 RepID=A0ABS4VYU8_9PSEU|nr:hypothetical protein [Pseudonocardia parietis]MBP2369121.1 hypothetical protein [Pseudonocardia parietis]
MSTSEGGRTVDGAATDRAATAPTAADRAATRRDTAGRDTTDGRATNGAATDAGATDGGVTNGTATDGGATDGGATDGGARAAGGPLALPAAGLRLAAALTARPSLLLRHAGGWAAELGRVGLGRSGIAPGPDARSTGPVRLPDPVRRRAVQAFLVTADALSGLLDDAAGPPDSPLPPEDAERLRVPLLDLTVLIAPGTVDAAPRSTGSARWSTGSARSDGTTHPTPRTGRAEPAGGPGTPASPRTSATPGPGIEPGTGPATSFRPAGTGSTGSGTGAPATSPAETAEIAEIAEIAERVFTAPGPGDPGVPFDTGAREAGGGPVPGRDVAAAPGAVVARTPMFELLQYLPVTEQVHDAPVLVVPPLVHRYWLADLAPGFSLVEHLVAEGLQVFALSWRPAGPEDAGRDLDAHAAAVLDAVDACLRIARTPRVSLLGLRTGGLLTAAVQAHLTAIGLDDRIAAAGYLATVLDGSGAPPRPGTGPHDREPRSDPGYSDGYGDGGPHGRAARAMRTWLEDRLPLPAPLRADMAALAGGADTAVRVLGTPVHPAGLRRDGYLVTAADDPGRPWTAGYRTARSLGGSCRLVLAPGDRAGAVIAPPRLATSFRVAPCDAGDGAAEAWLAAAEHVEGSWWDDLAGWLADRSGALRDAPPELGGRRLPPLFPAPGTYLRAAAGVPART